MSVTAFDGLRKANAFKIEGANYIPSFLLPRLVATSLYLKSVLQLSTSIKLQNQFSFVAQGTRWNLDIIFI